ncbi:MAG: oleate hydratase [Candidatus Rifleibacteriota bacterium]
MNKVRAFLAGSGLAGLATAFYLIKDGKISGENITIYEEHDFTGGSLDAFYNPEFDGYFMRGFRMLEPYVYSAMLELMSDLPCPVDPDKTIFQDFIEFNNRVKTCSRSRLVANGRAINARPLTLKIKDRVKILKLLTQPEHKIENLAIEDYFSPDFFSSNFWYQFCTTFSFQPWHSVEEFKRYILRFFQAAPTLDTHTCIRSTRYNQYESIALPLKKWLSANKVKFKPNTDVEDIDFKKQKNKLHINKLELVSEGRKQIQEISKNDLVFLSLGSMSSNYSVGAMNKAPIKKYKTKNPSWELWKKIENRSPQFGKPSVFYTHIDKTKWISFTITFSKPLFFKLIEKITQTPPGTEGPMTLIDSNWLISFALPHQPHFVDQPQHLQVLWGYGLYPDKKGNFVDKKMSDCNGEEILIEIIHHLKFKKYQNEIINSANCIPCLMPHITSQFMPRKIGDRPKVVPPCSKNFAFIGQFSEIPQDIVFTLEYSVRSAQIAAYSLLNINKTPTPIYPGWKRLKHVFNIVRTAFR